jgi:molybdenum cofactor cytidylyltransferase
MIELSVVVLAAGGSSRVGVSKQMMKLRGRTLVAMACERALQLSKHVTLISGAEHHRIEANIAHLRVSRVYNPHWSSGLASSVALACKHEFNSKKMLLIYCHQPLIPFEHFQKLVAKSEKEPGLIIATEFNDCFGLPAIIPQQFYYELSNLKGDESPEVFIESHLSQTRSISCETAGKKLITREDMSLLS